ncbi:MAG TPA: hypothetical protein VI078_08150 [bacterium]
MQSSLSRGLAVAAALCVLAAGCAGQKPAAGPEQSPAEVYARLLGPNQGLSTMRAVVEAQLSYAGRRISLPGVLLLDSLGGFRLDLLDPLDRPVAMIYSEGGRIVQYRPGTGVAASLGVFPGDCRGVVPEDWVAAVLASSSGPPAGESLAIRSFWRDRVLERRRDGALRESVRFREEAGGPTPRTYLWYCGEEDPVLQMQVRGSAEAAGRRMPGAFEVSYLKAGLTVSLQLREVESNPSLASTPVRPRLADGTNWTSWRLP